jgi:predicted RNA binding protein YcfA (HicA-like mRNA interferase family)
MMQRLGYEVLRRRGSHVRLRLQTGSDVHVETIPDHKVLAKGTLGSILRHVSKATGKSADELKKLLRE